MATEDGLGHFMATSSVQAQVRLAPKHCGAKFEATKIDKLHIEPPNLCQAAKWATKIGASALENTSAARISEELLMY